MKRNAYFQLLHEKDGLYLQSHMAEDGGLPLRFDDILQYLNLKKYTEVDVSKLQSFVEQSKEGNTKIKILDGTDFLPEKETAVITVDPYKRMAKIRLYPPSSGGREMTKEEVFDLVNQQGIVYGVIEKNITLMLRAKLYCTDILVAKATMPVAGSDAEITYHFDVKKTNTPTLKEDGTVDYHKLDMMERVQEGQLLATLTPEVLGTPGTDVFGNELQPPKVKHLSLKHGKNIHLSEDSCEMYSDVSGNVSLVEDTVFVTNVYEVPADVGTSTGDIEYDGSVEVKGNVITGFKVEATGDIIVNGAVEGATLISGGKIVLKRGIQGMGKGYMEAKGDVISNFIESSEVKAGGSITAEAIMHSKVEANGEVIVEGKRGLIAGGSVSSSVKITAKVVGSTMGTKTDLEVGLDMGLSKRHQLIEKEMEKLSGERDGLLKNISILKKKLKSAGKLSDEKIKLLKSSVGRVQEIGGLMESLTEEYEQIEEELESKQGGGKIIVEDVIYPGAKLTISNVVSHIDSEAKHSCFVRDGADIRIRAI